MDLSGEVIVPSFTFVATAHALQWQEITPVFCDIDPVTHTINPDEIERLITPKTTGIIGVHLWGGGCKTNMLEEIAKRHRLRLLFDASHAFACRHENRHIGTFGSAEVFSFHATKFVNTFEGGAVVTNDDTLARRLRLMKNFGFAGYDSVVYLGTNGKMSEVSAAMGLTMVEELADLKESNRRRYELYKIHLTGLRGVRFVDLSVDTESNWQYVVVEVEESQAGMDRDSLMKILHAENVLARRYFYPGCHRMEPYKSYYPHASLLLPVTEEICKRVLVLPTGPTLTEDDVVLICEIVRTAMENAGSLRQRFEARLEGD